MPFFWLLCAGLTAWVAWRKGRNAWIWFVLGLVGGLLALIVVALMPRPALPGGQAREGWPGSARRNDGGAGSGWENLRSRPGGGPDSPAGDPGGQASPDVIDVPFREVASEPCPACGAQVEEGDNFCGNCGKKLKFKFTLDKKSDPLGASSQRCAKCGQMMAKGAAFCANCGNRARQTG